MAKYAVISGSFKKGFGFSLVTDNIQTAMALAVDLATRQELAEVLEVDLPSSLPGGNKDFSEGNLFVVFETRLYDGVSIYGPFPDYKEASLFATGNRETNQNSSMFVPQG